MGDFSIQVDENQCFFDNHTKLIPHDDITTSYHTCTCKLQFHRSHGDQQWSVLNEFSPCSGEDSVQTATHDLFERGFRFCFFACRVALTVRTSEVCKLLCPGVLWSSTVYLSKLAKANRSHKNWKLKPLVFSRATSILIHVYCFHKNPNAIIYTIHAL